MTLTILKGALATKAMRNLCTDIRSSNSHNTRRTHKIMRCARPTWFTSCDLVVRNASSGESNCVAWPCFEQIRQTATARCVELTYAVAPLHCNLTRMTT